MPDLDWTEGRYVRVFASLQADYPEVWADDHLLAWYVRLLQIADATWPAPAPWPRALPDAVEADLVETGAIDRAGPGYLVSGMTHLRTWTRTLSVVGGRARAAQATRDAHGRMLPADPLVQPAGTSPLVQPAGDSSPLGPAGESRTNGASAAGHQPPLVQGSSDQTRPDRPDQDGGLTAPRPGRGIGGRADADARPPGDGWPGRPDPMRRLPGPPVRACPDRGGLAMPGL